MSLVVLLSEDSVLMTQFVPLMCIVKNLDKHSSKWGCTVLSLVEEVENLAHFNLTVHNEHNTICDGW